MNLRSKTVVGLASVALLVPLGVSANATPKNVWVDTAASVSVSSQLILQAIDCSNANGPEIRVTGGSSESVSASTEFIFENPSGKKTSPAITRVPSATINVSSIDSFDKRKNFGGAGGNPYIYVQLSNDVGLQLIGRCVQSKFEKDTFAGKAWENGNGFPMNLQHKSADVPLDFSSSVLTTKCTPDQSQTSEKNLLARVRPQNANDAGINAQFVFSNRGNLENLEVVDGQLDSPQNGNHYSSDSADVRLSVVFGGAGTNINRSEWKTNGVGGNPIVKFEITSNGKSQTLNLGRCKDLLG